ncbi:MAG: FAD/NAD(P)-binding oxidoreductase [Pseudomonadota bacterium]
MTAALTNMVVNAAVHPAVNPAQHVAARETAELLVLGAGPAGLAAAEAASAHGLQVTLIDENFEPGGQIWRGGPSQWRDRSAHVLWRALRGRPGFRFIGGARLVACVAPNVVLLETPEGARQLAWQRMVLCSGARELLLPFPGWTLPGVSGAGGLQAMIKGGMPVAGQRVVVGGSGPLLLAVADTARRHGAQVLAIAEHQPTRALARFGAALALRHPAKLAQALRLRAALAGVPYLSGAVVTQAHGAERLRAVTLRQGTRERRIECDLFACGFGLVPNTELASLLGCAIAAGRVQVDAQQRSSRADVWAAGEAGGIGGVGQALAQGRMAGLAAAGHVFTARERRQLGKALTEARAFGTLLAGSFAPLPALREICRPSTLVCRCEDVSAAQLAVHADWRSAKLHTRAGMGPCQGRVCASACEFLFGWQAPLAVRQPIFPTSAATLAGAAPVAGADSAKG